MWSGSSRAGRVVRGGGARGAAARAASLADPGRVPRSREDRLLLAARRLEEERDAKLAGNRAYEEYRATGRDTQGRKLSKQPKPWTAPEAAGGGGECQRP